MCRKCIQHKSQLKPTDVCCTHVFGTEAKESEDDDDDGYDDSDANVIWETASWTFMSSLATLAV